MTGRAPERIIRHSIRLKGYDYLQAGGYYVTIVTLWRECLFGEVVDSEMRVNALGKIVQEEWFRSARIRKEIHLFEDEFVVMPNHIHGIVWIDMDTVGADGVRPVKYMGAHSAGACHAPLHREPKSLGSFIAGFKASVTSRAGRELNSGNIWQRNYACRALSGITNTSSATRPITNASPVTSSIPHFVGLTRSTGIRTRRIPKTPLEREMLRCEIETTDSQINRLVSPSPPTGMLREGTMSRRRCC